MTSAACSRPSAATPAVSAPAATSDAAAPLPAAAPAMLPPPPPPAAAAAAAAAIPAPAVCCSKSAGPRPPPRALSCRALLLSTVPLQPPLLCIGGRHLCRCWCWCHDAGTCCCCCCCGCGCVRAPVATPALLVGNWQLPQRALKAACHTVSESQAWGPEWHQQACVKCSWGDQQQHSTRGAVSTNVCL
jgi:hypothetical protein